MNNSYLVAHLAAGSPRFDVAEREDCPQGEACEGPDCTFCDGDGHWWQLIGGWRCYPYWSATLDCVFTEMDGYPIEFYEPPEGAIDTWHHSGHDGPTATVEIPMDLLKQLGLQAKPVKRRAV